jgi:hypothetical protein
VEGRDDPVREPEGAGEEAVDAPRRRHRDREGTLGLARQHPRPVHAVAADVHDRAAVERRIEPDVAAGHEREAEDGAHRLQAADRAVPDERAQPVRLRVVAVHERLRQHAPCPLRRVEGALGVRRPRRERLLAEHVLPRLERPHRPLDVERVRERDVDRVHLVVGQERLVAPVRAVDGVLARPRLGARD